MPIRDQIIQLVRGKDLTQEQASEAMEEIMTGAATPAQIAAFLTALHLKGESETEIAGMAQVMREKSLRVRCDTPVLDTCGTGGDSSGTFNISTTAAFIAAGAGATVAKHGNRAMSSACGSADVLEALGVNIELDADGVERCLREAGIGFMFAQKFHPAMRYAAPVRREIGIRTVFNIIGPLTNPAWARHQVLGVANIHLAEKLGRALARLGTTHTLVVYGDGDTDELTLSGTNMVIDVRAEQELHRYEISAEQLGLTPASKEALRGGDAPHNAATIQAILSGEETGPRRDVALLNSAAALIAADQVSDWREALDLARQSIRSGAAQQRLERMIAVSRAAQATRPHSA